MTPAEEIGPLGARSDLRGPVLDATIRHEVLADMRRAIERAGAGGLDPVLLTEEGRAHTVIVNRAAALRADLLVMGTHGRGGFVRMFLGSVTEKVLRTASCPVLTVPPSAPADMAAPVVFKKILCPVDFTPSALMAFQYALELGRQGGGCVTVLHALEYMDPEEPCEHVDFDIRKHRQHMLDHARDRLHALVTGEPRTWCDIEEVVAVNRAYREILQRATDSAIDLIVMGAQGAGGVELMLYGSNTQHVVRASPCPVLTVHA
jgi:nucleotide-binding universal stress UspA family protein